MSTRATYLFKGGEHYNDVCLYNHCDNYPEGAIHFIWAAFSALDPIRGSNMKAEAFIRANDRFEITGDGHDSHGDTEYHYTFNGDNLHVNKRHIIDQGGEGVTWTCIHDGPWWNFVAKYAHNEHFPLDDYSPVKLVDTYGFGKRPMTDAGIKKTINAECETLGHWASNGNGDRGYNWEHKIERIAKLKGVLAA